MAQLYPFFAANNVGRVENMRIISGRVVKSPVPLLSEGFFQSPSVRWEQRIDNGYPNVFYDEDAQEYRCYYTCFLQDDVSVRLRPAERAHLEYNFYRRELYRPRVAGILLATSKDGVHWIRPNLGVCAFECSRDNNIIMDNVHGASVFKDLHETDPEKRYKMVVRHDAHEKMAVSFSADGIHWCEPIDWPDYNPAGDTHNFAFWDARVRKYVLITRTWADGALRLSARCESDDFIHWSIPTEIYRGDGLDDQLYSMPVFEKDELYLGLGSFFHGGDRLAKDFDCVDCELLYSYDTHHWNRACAGQPIIPRAEGKYGDNVPDSCCIYASAPILKDGKYLIYYFGGNGQHTNFRESTLMCAVADPDALAGYSPKNERGGALATCQLSITGDELLLKAELAPNGRASACISTPFSIHAPLAPVQGFDFSDATLLPAGENLWRICFAKPLSTLDAVKRYVVALRAENATLFGFGGDVKPFRRSI